MTQLHVIRAIDLFAMLIFLAAATYFLQQLINMSMLMSGRKKRSIYEYTLQGKNVSKYLANTSRGLYYSVSYWVGF